MSDYSIEELAADRFCPVYSEKIGCELCCETVQVLSNILKRESVPELSNVTDIESAKKHCLNCPYAKTWEENY